MEESEKRRERLKAMRMEAAGRAGGDANPASSGLEPSGLSNPLIEIETASPSQYSSSRFGFYTDPMAAFSGDRRRNIPPQVSQGHYNRPPRPMYQDMNPSPLYHSPGVNSPGQTIFESPGAHFDQSPPQRMPMAPPMGRPQGNPPNAWGRSGGPFRPEPFYSNPPPNFTNPGFVQANPSYVSYGGGRGESFNNSPHYDSGRGRGRWQGNRTNQRASPSGRRGAGPHEPATAEQRPYMYYRKEMMEDPWKMLTPVVWKDANVNSRDSDESWLPKSISSKKAKVSGEASQISIPQQSLAEYLASSFNDSTDEAADDDQTT